MAHGTATIGVILVDHHRTEPHPGRSHTSLFMVKSMSVASALKPRVRTTIQLSKSIKVEKPKVSIRLCM